MKGMGAASGWGAALGWGAWMGWVHFQRRTPVFASAFTLSIRYDSQLTEGKSPFEAFVSKAFSHHHFLEVKLPYDPVCRSVVLSVGWLVGLSEKIPMQAGYFTSVLPYRSTF